MPRTIITKADIAAAGMEAETPDENEDTIPIGAATFREKSNRRSPISRTELTPDPYRDKLLKYIPAEIVALYLSLDLIWRSTAGADSWLRWLILTFGFVVTPVYLWRIQQVQKKIQLLISTAAFVVWTFALGGPFVTLSWYKAIYGALLLPMFTFLVPLINPGTEPKR